MEWGNGLESRWQTQGEGRNTEATLADQYRHGRDETVVQAVPAATGQPVRPPGTARAREPSRYHDHSQATSLVTTAP